MIAKVSVLFIIEEKMHPAEANVDRSSCQVYYNIVAVMMVQHFFLWSPCILEEAHIYYITV
jgi:hypothetical protein